MSCLLLLLAPASHVSRVLLQNDDRESYLVYHYPFLTMILGQIAILPCTSSSSDRPVVSDSKIIQLISFPNSYKCTGTTWTVLHHCCSMPSYEPEFTLKLSSLMGLFVPLSLFVSWYFRRFVKRDPMVRPLPSYHAIPEQRHIPSSMLSQP